MKSEKDKFKLIDSEIFKFDYFTICKDKVEFKNKEYNWHSLIPKSNGVLVLAAEGDKIIFIKQYRHAIKKPILELPGGMIDGGELPEKTAQRELEEETGYVADTLKPLGQFYVSSSFTSVVMHIFFANNLKKTKASRDESEIITIKKYPSDSIFDLIKSGELVDSMTLLAIMIAKKEKLIN